MTVYMYSPEEHAQIVEALSVAYPTDRSRLPDHVATLAMLKAMNPVSPSAWLSNSDGIKHMTTFFSVVQDQPEVYTTALYAKEQQ